MSFRSDSDNSMNLDIEMGEIQSNNSSKFLCFDCPENDNILEDDKSQTPSQATFA